MIFFYQCHYIKEIPRRDKVNVINDATRRSKSIYQTDPKRELADSLPLCHPNEDYLKDFTPMLGKIIM